MSLETKAKTGNDIYDITRVKNLFDEMSNTYGIVHLVSSLGFAYLWRKNCVDAISYPSNAVICDLMAGGGECCTFLKGKLNGDSQLVLVDFSHQMCQKAEQTLKRYQINNYQIICENALDLPLSDESIVSTFGLKTFNKNQTADLASEVARVLKPGGIFSLLEFSLPSNRLVRFSFSLYVKYYVPFLGKLLLGNPDNYRLLWEYTYQFGSCESVIGIFENAGFEMELRSYFFGSATHIIGKKVK
jgi:demethylmenaquinone methyltransferase / 2-methoxy-6-polyprenyl-1,4-benzoquinol methylase